jgi:hypothetical protein
MHGDHWVMSVTLASTLLMLINTAASSPSSLQLSAKLTWLPAACPALNRNTSHSWQQQQQQQCSSSSSSAAAVQAFAVDWH